jgi:metal-responsive CopG/Arc/MetJ family transcriptional regulator
MAKSIKVHQKKRGRPATGRDPAITVRLPQTLMIKIEQWGAIRELTRSEAIRGILEQALAPPSQNKPAKKRKAQEALELAERTAERLVDKSMPSEERDHCKRRVVKGPKELRETREDLPKSKP